MPQGKLSTMTRRPTFLRCRLLCAAALVTSAIVAGCGNITQLHVDDNSSTIVSARAVHRFGAGPGGGGLELELSSVRARGDQQLNAFETATVGSQSVSGPVLLRHTARVQHAQLVYNHLLFAGRPIELEWFAGAAWVQTSWTSLSANPADPRLFQQSSWYGPTGGVLGRLRLAPNVALELRYAAAADVRSSQDAGSRNATELALAFKPAPSLVLRAGLGESRTSLRPELLSTELSVRARGPFLNLGLDF
jgi:hypothetical protein